MGESIIRLYKEKIQKNWKIAFYSAFFATLLIHIFKFTNTLPNHDSLYNVYSDQDMTMSGRWFLQYVCGISSYFDLPWINGLLCAVYLGLTAVFVTELFDIKNPVVIVLSGFVLAGSPSTAETLFFEFTADGYLMGLLFCALAACLSCKQSKFLHCALSVMLLCLSCAIYQAYISFAIVLCVCYLVNRLLDGEISVKNAWKWIGKHVLIYISALLFYYAIWKLILLMTGRSATDYQGINEVGKVSLYTLVSGLIKSVENIFFYILEWNILEHPITFYGVLNIIFILCFILVLFIAAAKGKIYRKPVTLAMIVFCLMVCIPMISIWCFLSESVVYRPMMLHSICVLYIWGMILFDKWVNPKLSTVFGIFMAIVIFNYALMANISYFYLDKCYEKSYYEASQMMECIEDKRQENSDIEYIAFIGFRGGDVTISNTSLGNRIHILSNLLEEDLLYDHEHAYLYLKNVLGLDIPGASNDMRVTLESSDYVEKMAVWPAESSVSIVDNILVIKLK